MMHSTPPCRRARDRVRTMLVAILCAGCFTVTWDVPVEPLALAAREKLALRVRLCLTEDLRAAQWRDRVDPFAVARMPVGIPLADGAEQVARAAFAAVEVSENLVVFPETAVDAVLMPRVVSIDRTNPPTIFGEQETSVILEWTLSSSAGETLWVHTFTGRGKSKKSAHPDRTARVQMQAAIREVFEASFAALSSPVIRRVVVKVGASDGAPAPTPSR